jgi:hypothetical protein
MIRMPVVFLAVGVGFSLGLGVRAAKDAFAPPPPNERTVYCPIGTADRECVEARLRYERGELTTSLSPRSPAAVRP